MIRLFKTQGLKYIYSFRFLWMITAIALSMMFYITVMFSFGTNITYQVFQRDFLLSFFSSIILPMLAIIITAIEVGEDFESGCGKFFLISGISKKNFLTSKLLFITATIVLIIGLTYGATLLSGALLFHSTAFDITLVKGLLGISLSVLAIIMLTSIIALLSDSFQNTLIIAIGIYFLMLIADHIFNELNFTITFNITNPIMSNANSYLIPIAYSFVFFLVSIIIMKEKDVVL